MTVVRKTDEGFVVEIPSVSSTLEREGLLESNHDGRWDELDPGAKEAYNSAFTPGFLTRPMSDCTIPYDGPNPSIKPSKRNELYPRIAPDMADWRMDDIMLQNEYETQDDGDEQLTNLQRMSYRETD